MMNLHSNHIVIQVAETIKHTLCDTALDFDKEAAAVRPVRYTLPDGEILELGKVLLSNYIAAPSNGGHFIVQLHSNHIVTCTWKVRFVSLDTA